MEYVELLNAFAAAHGLNPVKPDEDGVCRFEIDGFPVAFMEIPERNEMCTWAIVGEIPAEGRERLYQSLLESMFLGQGTCGGVFSLERESGRIFLQRVDSLQALDPAKFESVLEGFANVLVQWSGIVSDYRAAAPLRAKGEADETERVRSIKSSGFLQV